MKGFLTAFISVSTLWSTFALGGGLSDQHCRPDDLNKGQQVCLAKLDEAKVVVTGDSQFAMVWQIVDQRNADSFIISARLLFQWQIVDGSLEGRPGNATNVFADATFAKDLKNNIDRVEVDAGPFGKSSARGFSVPATVLK